ncbi:MAG: transglutaminase-like domain-containing protein [Candidatus Levyibacteriota bacterium]
MKKLLTFLFLFAILLIPRQTFASETSDNFTVDSSTLFNVSDDGDTKVIQTLSITNKKEFVYSPSYSISLHLKTIDGISVRNSSGDIPYKIADGKDGNKTISIDFPDKVIGVGSSNKFSVSFSSKDFTQKAGDIWEFTIPSLADPEDFNSYTATVTVPSIFGKPSIIKPDSPGTQSGNSYSFSKSQLSTGGITMYFGDAQYYHFNLSYHLANNNLFPVSTEIALPPETSYQDVIIKDINPQPTSVYYDTDGNALATYTLAPKTSSTVKVDSIIKLSAFPSDGYLDELNREKLLSPQKYWEVKDTQITELAKKYKTPAEIYAYVVQALSYNYDKKADQNPRMGAKGVLGKPYYAVCLEFTDLFIAIARAAGIPARAVEGYAYTSDDSSRPVTLFQDILHSWPEFYDSQKNMWIMVDPTWGDTTHGTDYFNTFDYDHVAFAVNGSSSTYPVPAGGYKTSDDSKDVNMTFAAASDFQQTVKTKISPFFSSFSQGSFIDGKITLTNDGNHSVKPEDYTVFVDGKQILGLTFPKTPPFGSSTITMVAKIPKQKSYLESLTNISHTVTIKDSNGSIVSSSQIKVFPFSINYVIGGALAFGSIIVFIIAFKTRSISVFR